MRWNCNAKINQAILQASLAKLVEVEVFVQVTLAQMHKGTNQGLPLVKYKSDLTTKVLDNQLFKRIQADLNYNV